VSSLMYAYTKGRAGAHSRRRAHRVGRRVGEARSTDAHVVQCEGTAASNAAEGRVLIRSSAWMHMLSVPLEFTPTHRRAEARRRYTARARAQRRPPSHAMPPTRRRALEIVEARMHC
jgi:hypothetical protein